MSYGFSDDMMDKLLDAARKHADEHGISQTLVDALSADEAFMSLVRETCKQIRTHESESQEDLESDVMNEVLREIWKGW